jgi:hypothetical protein
MLNINNDPRDRSLETTFTIPHVWSAQDNVGSCLFQTITIEIPLHHRSAAALGVSLAHPRSFVVTDGLATSGMFLAGLIMVTRNRSFLLDLI